jgi:hypothetical protein
MVDGLKAGPVEIDGAGFKTGALEEGADSMSVSITSQPSVSLIINTIFGRFSRG